AHAGYYSRWGSWGAVEDVMNLNTPKYNALVDVAQYLHENEIGGGEPGEDPDPGEEPGEDGEILFQDDFSSGEGWSIADSSSMSIAGGMLNGANWSATAEAIYENEFGGTYSFSVEATPESSSGHWNATRILFHYKDSDNYYELTIGNG